MKVLTALALAAGLIFPAHSSEVPHVAILRTPNDGIQPQAVVDGKGLTHLIYYKGETASGDIFYVRYERDSFSKPIQVNSTPGSAIAAGTIRGAQLAVGRNGRVHVAWNGHAPKGGNYMQAPMLYTRLTDAGSAFEPERDVITAARGLDGGGSVAADNAGNVYVMWHAPKPGNTNGEPGRAVFVAHSTNDGKTFAPERLATTKPTGACGCCGMKAFADSGGNVFALYRGASDKLTRDEILLVARGAKSEFEVAFSHPWKIATCPMSSAFFSESNTGVLAAWETEGQVYFARVDAQTVKISDPISPAGTTRRKHPVAIANPRSEVLFAWTEGTSWGKGGAVAWQLYDAQGNPTAEKGKRDGVPAWSLVTACARPDGGFTIVY